MAIGVGAIAIITVVFALLGHDVSPTIPALLLLVPRRQRAGGRRAR